MAAVTTFSLNWCLKIKVYLQFYNVWIFLLFFGLNSVQIICMGPALVHLVPQGKSDDQDDAIVSKSQKVSVFNIL